MRGRCALVSVIVIGLIGGLPGSLAAQASAPDSPGWSFGLAAGGGAAWLTTPSEEAEIRAAPGWSVGLWAERPIHERLTLHSELLYTERGAREHLLIVDQALERWYRTQYLRLPVLARYAVPVGPEWLSPYATAGAAPAVQLRATNTVNGRIENMDEQVRSWDAALILGAGTRVPTRIGRFWVDARYDIGLVNVDATPRGGGANRNTAVTLMAGYTLPWPR